MRHRLTLIFFLFAAIGLAATPVTVTPVTAPHGMVVAAHPQAAAAGVAVLKNGGNAIDAAIATSLAVGVAEPYGSGLGGKLMLLYYEAKSGKTFVVDAMDACGTGLSVEAQRQFTDDAHSYGYAAVCVPGLGAGLWEAHRRWGTKPWADDVAPAITLARDGFEILPKTRDMFEEQDRKLHRGDAEIARLHLPGGKMPAIGSRLKNADLAHTLELVAQQGRDGFYRGEIAERIVHAAQQGGGALTLDDFAQYQARVTEPIEMDFRGYHLVCAPPPAQGPALFLTIMKVLEDESFDGGPLRTADNLDKLGRAWRLVQPQASRAVGDTPGSRFAVERLLAPDSIRALRKKLRDPAVPRVTTWTGEPWAESPMAATTHFEVVDAQGNIVCATQSLSLHFGAGVVVPGTGVVLNDSMSNFTFTDPRHPNFVAPGRRPRSTISPTIVLRDGKPVFALGIPGAARIPTAMLQGLLDRLALGRPLAEAIGDTRVHFNASPVRDEGESFEAERSLPAGTVEALRAKGWRVVLPEEAGRGRHFGGLNAIEFNADGTLTGYADPRRTNAAAGW
jgi:gamma-glutamyltranspeptidase/glutathione hydrolase